jgi:hypothetical protein
MMINIVKIAASVNFDQFIAVTTLALHLYICPAFEDLCSDRASFFINYEAYYP